MKSPDSFPRVPLAQLPTPLQRLDSLSAHLGRELYIKRDDLTGVALGGNKVRKLEFLLAQARALGADTVITTGAAQSNHAMLTAACAGRLGLRSLLLLKRRGVSAPVGNLRLDAIFGAETRLLDTDSYADIGEEMRAAKEELEARGHRAFLIPLGGSTPVGALGYVRCAMELRDQAEKMNVHPDHLVLSTSSGGTFGGMLLGLRLYLPGVRAVGVAVDNGPAAQTALALAADTARLLELPPDAVPGSASCVEQAGEGYGIPSREGAEAIRLLARREGILLDPVYTGKAFAGLLRMIDEGRFGRDETIVFLHTGGAGALFAYDAFW